MTRSHIHSSCERCPAPLEEVLVGEAQEAAAGRAERLRTASAHWLRHTAGSRMANQDVDLRHVRDTFGHASISTTNIYLHAEDNQRHQAIEAAHRLGWD